MSTQSRQYTRREFGGLALAAGAVALDWPSLPFLKGVRIGVQSYSFRDRSLDEALVIEDGDVTLVPKGYHPVAAVHGYDLYYLNVMAGPKRTWKIHNAKEHEWLIAK